MASFMVDLWESIFTPGPTPPLLKAANVTFAALQACLLALLIGTYSYHFVILSTLCAGLWWSINWFAAELKHAQAMEKEAEARKKKEDGEGEDLLEKQQGDNDGEETEVEGAAARQVSGAALPVEPVEKRGELRKRGEARGTGIEAAEVSQEGTEDEWEKVSEESREDE